MRDGLYRSLPLRRAWRGFLKSCEREAEHGEIRVRKAEYAIMRELRTEISPAFLTRLSQIAHDTESLLPTFYGFPERTTSRELQARNSSMENELLNHIKEREISGLRGKDLLRQGMMDTTNSVTDRFRRQIEQHCLIEAGAQARPILDGVREALKEASADRITSSLLAKKGTNRLKGKKPIDLDEDLTRRR